ncbi:hypothetical protein ACFE04_000895 [Oxalis oulophora]
MESRGEKPEVSETKPAGAEKPVRRAHQVYVIPDNHPLLNGLEKRLADDPNPYLLSVWAPGETARSTEPPTRKCTTQEHGKLCDDETCSSCNTEKEANSNILRGTLFIPCFTAMGGICPSDDLFEDNEVFADHESSLEPIAVPKALICNLPRRTLYCGTSITSILKGMTVQEVKQCFLLKGFVCDKAIDRRTREPHTLTPRLLYQPA